MSILEEVFSETGHSLGPNEQGRDRPHKWFSETEKGPGSDGPDPFSLLHTPRQRISTLRLEGLLTGYKDRLREIPLDTILIKLSAVGRLVRVLRLHNGNPFNFPCA